MWISKFSLVFQVIICRLVVTIVSQLLLYYMAGAKYDQPTAGDDGPL